MIAESLRRFTAGCRALNPDASFGYYLDLLDVIEAHREELRGATWPESLALADPVTYRTLLLAAEELLRDLPGHIADPAYLEEVHGLVSDLVHRADAVADLIDGSGAAH